MQLDKKQLEVINYLDNLLVIAGAGTGKTFCITKKIEYLKNNYNALDSDFLVVSFTNESVDDLKKKLNNIDIFTFHKLALNIIPQNKYKLCNEYLLNYVINEYFDSFITKKEKIKLLFFFWEYNYNSLLQNNNFIGFKKIIFTYIKLIQCNNLDLEYLKNIYKSEKNLLFITIIIKIYLIYKKEKEAQNVIDLDDLIIIASKINKTFKYKYIFVDEFQDTSLIRFNLIYNIYIHSNSKLYLFGDDYQSIYHFSGCNLNIMLDIKKYIPNIKFITLDKTFRNSQELITVANKFIMKNKKQIPKKMISYKHLNRPIEIIYYDNPKKCLKNVIEIINDKYLILGRNNNDIFKYQDNDDNYLTIHKSKGLECENVIIINLENNIYGIPCKIKNYYLLNQINKMDEINYAEERRLFYVALTRTKGKVYLLVNKHNPSIFIKEIEKGT
jgi:DNA helicase-4